MKRFLCVICLAALLVLCAACGNGVLDDAPAPTAAPTASSSRNVKEDADASETTAPADTAEQEPVTVTETHANSEVVNSAATAEGTQVDTPATGDFPVGYFALVLGLILISAAGLLMLRRI